MSYSLTVTGLVATKRADAGNTIHEDWGSAVENDLIGLAGSVNGNLIPTADLTNSLGDATHRYGSAWINVLELSGAAGSKVGMGGTQILDLNRNLISIAGLSVDSTARKLIVEIANHRYKLFNYINSYSVPNGASTLGTTVWTTSPLPGTFRGANIIVIPQAQTNAALFEALPFAVNGSSYNIDFQNGTGGPVVVDIYVEATCTQ